jgi:hypothetical protein
MCIHLIIITTARLFIPIPEGRRANAPTLGVKATGSHNRSSRKRYNVMATQNSDSQAEQVGLGVTANSSRGSEHCFKLAGCRGVGRRQKKKFNSEANSHCQFWPPWARPSVWLWGAYSGSSVEKKNSWHRRWR